MSASDVIARLRVAFANASMDEDDEITRALPALLECAEVLEKVAHMTRHAPAISSQRDLHDAARAALEALVGGGE